MTPAKTNAIKNEAYGVRLQSMEDVPPTIGEIQLLPPWVRPWVLRQLVQWILEHNGDVDELLQQVNVKSQAQIVINEWGDLMMD